MMIINSKCRLHSSFFDAGIEFSIYTQILLDPCCVM